MVAFCLSLEMGWSVVVGKVAEGHTKVTLRRGAAGPRNRVIVWARAARSHGGERVVRGIEKERTCR
jgi:hypothetical protein